MSAVSASRTTARRRAQYAATLLALMGCGQSTGPLEPGRAVGPSTANAAGAAAVSGRSAAGNGGNTGAAGASVGTAGAGDYSFEATVQPFIDQACNCHQSTPTLMAPFSLKPGEAYGQLVGMPSQQLPSMQRVKPGSLQDSYLWHKIEGTQADVGGSGLVMPSNIPLNATEKLIFQRWIEAGAPR